MGPRNIQTQADIAKLRNLLIDKLQDRYTKPLYKYLNSVGEETFLNQARNSFMSLDVSNSQHNICRTGRVACPNLPPWMGSDATIYDSFKDPHPIRRKVLDCLSARSSTDLAYLQN